MKKISISEKALLVATGIVIILSPIMAIGADSSQATEVVVPINLTVPLLPAITVLTNNPTNGTDKVLVIIPEAGGLLGIARLSGGI